MSLARFSFFLSDFSRRFSHCNINLRIPLFCSVCFVLSVFVICSLVFPAFSLSFELFILSLLFVCSQFSSLLVCFCPWMSVVGFSDCHFCLSFLHDSFLFLLPISDFFFLFLPFPPSLIFPGLFRILSLFFLVFPHSFCWVSFYVFFLLGVFLCGWILLHRCFLFCCVSCMRVRFRLLCSVSFVSLMRI